MLSVDTFCGSGGVLEIKFTFAGNGGSNPSLSSDCFCMNSASVISLFSIRSFAEHPLHSNFRDRFDAEG